MKVGAIPDGLFEKMLVKANQIPVPLIDSFSAMMNAKAILAANEIGLFNALDERPSTPHVLSKHLGVSLRGVTDLIDALCANGYLRRDGERVTLTDISRKWLARSSPNYVGHMLEHVNDLWAVWLNLEEAIRIGTTPALNYQDVLKDEKHREMLRRHILGLRDTARLSAPEMLRMIRLPDAKSASRASSTSRRLLDVGGGHGGYSIAFCEKYPDLTATVFELEATAEIGREIVEREGMSNRVEFQTGDFLKDDFDSGYAAALYFNILHNYSEEDNRRVLKKVYDALAPGGVLAVWDMFKEKRGSRDVLPALMALHMLVASGGTSFLIDDVYCWLRETGFKRLARRQTRTLPGLTLITAYKP
ncbi:MAG TPA: methyltransferase [Blastocatellia bacterium]|nr:methyltransferase [Blastocatellia bacterium]